MACTCTPVTQAPAIPTRSFLLQLAAQIEQRQAASRALQAAKADPAPSHPGTEQAPLAAEAAAEPEPTGAVEPAAGGGNPQGASPQGNVVMAAAPAPAPSGEEAFFGREGGGRAGPSEGSPPQEQQQEQRPGATSGSEQGGAGPSAVAPEGAGTAGAAGAGAADMATDDGWDDDLDTEMLAEAEAAALRDRAGQGSAQDLSREQAGASSGLSPPSGPSGALGMA